VNVESRFSRGYERALEVPPLISRKLVSFLRMRSWVPNLAAPSWEKMRSMTMAQQIAVIIMAIIAVLVAIKVAPMLIKDFLK